MRWRFCRIGFYFSISFLCLSSSSLGSSTTPDGGFRGLDYKAALAKRANQRCMAAIRLLKDEEKPALSFVWEKFGDDERCVKAFTELYAKREHLLYIHLFDDSSRKYGAADFFPPLTDAELSRRIESGRADAAILKRVESVFQFTQRVAGERTHIALVPTGLEDRLSPRARRRIRSLTRRIWPYLVAANPVGTLSHGSADVIELHTSESGDCRGDRVISNDGSVLDLREARDYVQGNRGCYALFLWGPWQGRPGPRYVPVRLRKYERVDPEFVYYAFGETSWTRQNQQ